MVISIVDIALSTNWGYVKVVRSFRAVKLIKYNLGMKQLLDTLSRSLPTILNIFFIGGLVYLIFALILMSLL